MIFFFLLRFIALSMHFSLWIASLHAGYPVIIPLHATASIIFGITLPCSYIFSVIYWSPDTPLFFFHSCRVEMIVSVQYLDSRRLLFIRLKYVRVPAPSASVSTSSDPRLLMPFWF